MKILLIGHSIIDHLDDKLTAKIYPGGVYYSTLGILSVKRDQDEIKLITGYNSKSFSLFEKIYNKIDLTYSTEISEMPEVFLKITDENEREEYYKNISSNLPITKDIGWNQFDGILINMITGFDISVEQLERIRNSFTGKIFMDVHTLSRGVDENLKRKFRKIPNIERWLKNIDIIQCNENELKTISDLENEYDAAVCVLNSGPKILVITKGERGATCYLGDENDISKLDLQAEKVEVKNKVGCGDIFGTVFFYSYLDSGNLEYSLKSANKTVKRIILRS